MDILSLVIGIGSGFLIGVTIGIIYAYKKSATTEQQNIELKTRIKLESEAHQKAMAEMENRFKLTASEALRQNNEQFIMLAEEKLKSSQKDASHDLENRQKAISDIINPIGKTLKEMEGKIENLGKTGASLEGQLKSFSEGQHLLREETRNLIEALRNPAARGRWGEMQLERTLEMIGMVEGTHYKQQVSVNNSEGKRIQPDFIITLSGGMQIVIDVKAPIEPFWEAMETADNEADKNAVLNKFKSHMREHLKQLAKKEYWRQFDSPEFVVMFLPTEGLYSMAVSNDKSLLEDAAKNNIILASPTTVMGLLRTVMHGWQQQTITEEAKKVSELAADLYKRICRFGEHMAKLGRGLNTAMNAYNIAVGSLESQVLPGARKFKELHVQTGGKEIPEITVLEETPRNLSSPELLSKKDNDS